MNVDAHPDWLMHDYHRAALDRKEPSWPNSRPGWDRAHPNFQAWLSNLKAQQIQLLVVTRANSGEGPHNVADSEGFPIERLWADSHPELFEPLYGPKQKDPFFRLYRFARVVLNVPRVPLRAARHDPFFFKKSARNASRESTDILEDEFRVKPGSR